MRWGPTVGVVRTPTLPAPTLLVDAQSITIQTLAALAERGEVEPGRVAEAISRYDLSNPAAADAGNTEGSG